jgi:hypothetical protein
MIYANELHPIFVLVLQLTIFILIQGHDNFHRWKHHVSLNKITQKRNLVLFHPHTLQLLFDLTTFQRHLVILSLQVFVTLINGQYYS